MLRKLLKQTRFRAMGDVKVLATYELQGINTNIEHCATYTICTKYVYHSVNYQLSTHTYVTNLHISQTKDRISKISYQNIHLSMPFLNMRRGLVEA